MKFTKMNGAGNDFVMVDNRERRLELPPARIARLCDRHRGIGADGLLAVEPGGDGADFTMRYYNSDGGEAEMCGNGARCFARFASRLAGPLERLTFATRAGVVSASIAADGIVTIGMSEPHSLESGVELDLDGQPLIVHALNTGVPHAVIECPRLDALDMRTLGRHVRHHPHFAPSGTNVNAFEWRGERQAEARTYERGVEDETLACGTGVVATAIVMHELRACGSPVAVDVQGGSTLEVGFRRQPDGYRDVTLTGPADFVFDGETLAPGCPE